MKDLETIQNVDVYLLDQILKNRYNEHQFILDAGCGLGRNLKWFASQKNFKLFAADINKEAISLVDSLYSNISTSITKIENLPYNDEKFDHIICSAVLHFAEDETHFFKMFSELIRVLKKEGTLFIRMTTDVGVRHTIFNNKNGVYNLKDGSTRFLITRDILTFLLNKYNLELIAPFKTTVVEDLRSMATIVIRKK